MDVRNNTRRRQTRRESTSMDASVANLFASKNIANASRTNRIVAGIAVVPIARTCLLA